MEPLVAQAMERQGGSVMDLEERIARLIDPEVWETVDYLRVIELPLTAQEMTKSSLIAARRVIDGLNLDED